MAHAEKQLLAFNRGVVSKLGLARLDIEKLGMSAEVQKNWIPRVLGAAIFRPATKYIDTMDEDLNLTRQMPFIFGVDDTALLELGSNGTLKVRVNDVVLSRPVVTATVTNGDFNTDLSGWTVIAPGATSVVWNAGSAVFMGDGTNFCKLRQQVTVPGGETSIEHSLEVWAPEGMVLRVGSTAGGDDYFTSTVLPGGTHNVAFTPVFGNYWIELAWDREYEASVTRCREAASGDMVLFHPWTSDDRLRNLRWAQSGDVMYCASGPISKTDAGTSPRKIVRFGVDGRSWVVSSYAPNDGPFRRQNVSAISITPSALKGEITLTASDDLFDQSLGFGTGALFRLASSGQTVTDTVSVAPVVDEFTDPIRVVGNGTARTFGIIVEGTFSATVTLQFAFSEDGPWNDQGSTYTTPISTNYTDGQDDQIIFYRIGVKVGDYTSGAVTFTLTYTGGSIEGIVRIGTVSTPLSATATVLKNLGAITPTRDWWEGEWSSLRGYPSAVDLHEGRLWWAGDDKIWGSVSDQYESFDDSTEGDSGPISRQIGFGPIRVIHWLLSLGRLMLGTAENSANIAAAKMDGNHPLGVRSNSFDEPLTPFNFNIKTSSSKAVFVDRTEQRLYELLYDIDQQDYRSIDLSVLTPDFNEVGIVQIAVQMKPDIRVHCVRADGTVGMLVYDRTENVIAWIDVEMGKYIPAVEQGFVEDVAVLPGKVEDQVYYTVQRNTGPTGLGERRYLEKWAMESEAIGGTYNYLADSALLYDGVPITTMTGLEHLQGFEVSVWADGADRGVGTVTIFGTPGELDLTTLEIDGVPTDNSPYSVVIVGLAYNAQFQSAKLGELTGIGLLADKKVARFGFLALNIHYQGIQYGPTFDQLYDLPRVEMGQVTPDDTVWAEYHQDDFPFGGEWDVDSRVCIQAQSPRPATLQAAIVDYEAVERDYNRRSR